MGMLPCLLCHSWNCSATAGISHSCYTEPGPELGWQPECLPASAAGIHAAVVFVQYLGILFKIISVLSQWEALEYMIQSFDFLFCGRPVPSTSLWSRGGYTHSTTEMCWQESLNYPCDSYPGKSLHCLCGQADKNRHFPNLKYQWEFVASPSCISMDNPINRLSLLWDS